MCGTRMHDATPYRVYCFTVLVPFKAPISKFTASMLLPCNTTWSHETLATRLPLHGAPR